MAWSERGINGIKRQQVIDVLREGIFELLTLTGMKMIGNEEISKYGVGSICVGVQGNKNIREGMVVLPNTVGLVDVAKVKVCVLNGLSGGGRIMRNKLGLLIVK